MSGSPRGRCSRPYESGGWTLRCSDVSRSH
ncbi:TPA_asm: hypothetical protein [Porphyromonas phage phage026a_KCOM2802]|uniref:Uncharacterized protein n=1 Tax=Porphyromonas phage phage026a_KCOM2802 TaxID=3154116 RepID=A0AAT9JDG4_9CAUD